MPLFLALIILLFPVHLYTFYELLVACIPREEFASVRDLYSHSQPDNQIPAGDPVDPATKMGIWL